VGFYTVIDQVDSQSRAIGDSQAAIFDFQFRRLIHDLIVIRAPIGKHLLDVEVGDTRIDLKRDCGTYGTGTVVGLNPHVVDFGHSSNLLGLHNPARYTRIWLKNVRRLQFHDSAETVASVYAFSGSDRNPQLVSNSLHGFDIERINWFLKELEVEFFESVAQTDDRIRR